MSAVSSSFRIDGTALAYQPAATQQVVMGVLAQIKDSIDGRRHAIGDLYARRYRDLMLAGEKPMPLHFFVHLLSVVHRLGEKKNAGQGRECVRRILAILAAPFGLDVVIRGDRPTKDRNSEALEAAAAVGDVFQKLQTNASAAEIEGAVVRATDELHDVVKAVRS